MAGLVFLVGVLGGGGGEEGMAFSKARGFVLWESRRCVGEGVDWEIGKVFFFPLIIIIILLISISIPRLPPTLPIPPNINLTLGIPLLLHLQFRFRGKFLF